MVQVRLSPKFITTGSVQELQLECVNVSIEAYISVSIIVSLPQKLLWVYGQRKFQIGVLWPNVPYVHNFKLMAEEIGEHIIRLETTYKDYVNIEHVKNYKIFLPVEVNVQEKPEQITNQLISALPQFDSRILRDEIVSKFNENELKGLCFSLNIDYEEIPPTLGKTGKVQDLILLCQRKGILKELVTECQLQRPNGNWPGVLG